MSQKLTYHCICNCLINKYSFFSVLSAQNLPLPDISDFLNVKLPTQNRSANRLPELQSVNLPKNTWYFKYEEQPPPPGQADANMDELFDASMELGFLPAFSFIVFIAFTLTLDFIWFIHRMARTFSTAKEILYGYPCYIDAHGHINGKCMQSMTDKKYMLTFYVN